MWLGLMLPIALIGQAFDGTVLPLTLGFASVGMLAFVVVLIGEKGRLFGVGQALISK